MARSYKDRVNAEIRRALRDLHYIERCRAKGQDVSRLDEKERVARERLERHHRCFVCGTEQTHPESITAWQLDRLGSECRKKLAVAS